jgi:hypothetical protein
MKFATGGIYPRKFWISAAHHHVFIIIIAAETDIMRTHVYVKSQRNSFRKVSKQWAERSRNSGSIPGADRDLSLQYSVQTGSEAHSAPRPVGTVLLMWRWLKENAWNYTSSPTCVLLVCCLIKHKDNFVCLQYFYYICA